jgi:glycosyl transferase, family 25
MIKVYVINLDRSPDRLSWMSSQLAELKIDMRRVPAIDGSKLDPAVRLRWEQAREKSFGLGPIELACFLSHRMAWRTVAEGDDKYGFIRAIRKPLRDPPRDQGGI